MEMFGMIGGLAGAGASLAGGIMNAEAQDEANQLNFALAMDQRAREDRWREEMIAQALRNKREHQLGTTDIRGVRTHFIPGRGWVVEGTPEVNMMRKLQDAEQMKVLQHDLPQLRKQRDRNFARSFQDEATADTYRRELAGVKNYGDEGYAGDLLAAQMQALREADQKTGSQAYTTAFRTGANTSNIGGIAGALSRERGNAYAKAALTSRLAARGTGEAEANAKRNSYANLYNLFATRASNMPTVNYKPQNVDDGGTLSASMQGDLSTGALAAQAYGKKGGDTPLVPPNMGWGNAVAGAGSALASAFRGMGAQRSSGGGVQGFGSTSGYGDNVNIYQDEEFPSYA